MTHFKISDEALSVAGEAVEKASAELEMVQCVAYDREVSEAIARAAIEAAMPVMFERVAFVNPVLLNAVTEHNFLDKVNHKVRLRYEPKNSLEIPLYRIKEPK